MTHSRARYILTEGRLDHCFVGAPADSPHDASTSSSIGCNGSAKIRRHGVNAPL